MFPSGGPRAARIGAQITFYFGCACYKHIALTELADAAQRSTEPPFIAVAK